MRLSVSKGTYIRTICSDIGEKLGCGGVMESLLRTRAGTFTLDTALKLSDVEKVRDENRLDDILVKVDDLFDYEKITMKPSGDKAVHNGNIFFVRDTETGIKIKGNVLVYDSLGAFIGIYTYTEGKYKPYKMFL